MPIFNKILVVIYRSKALELYFPDKGAPMWCLCALCHYWRIYGKTHVIISLMFFAGNSVISMCANTEYQLTDTMDTFFLKSPEYPQPYNVQSDCQTTVNIDSDITKTALSVIDKPEQSESPLRIYLCGSDVEVNVRVNILPTRCDVLNRTKMSNKATSYFFQLYKFSASDEQRGILLELHRSEYPFLMYCSLIGPRLLFLFPHSKSSKKILLSTL